MVRMRLDTFSLQPFNPYSMKCIQISGFIAGGRREVALLKDFIIKSKCQLLFQHLFFFFFNDPGPISHTSSKTWCVSHILSHAHTRTHTRLRLPKARDGISFLARANCSVIQKGKRLEQMERRTTSPQKFTRTRARCLSHTPTHSCLACCFGMIGAQVRGASEM